MMRAGIFGLERPPARTGKVFCVGFNKTGTSSLSKVLADLGYTPYHHPNWTDVTDMQDPLLEQYDAFADGELAPIEAIAAAFPNSHFILNTRALLPWLVSRVTWVEHRRSVGATGPMRQELEEFGLATAVRTWVERRDEYHSRVLDFFEERPGSLLVLDFTADDDAMQKLTNFLGRASEIKTAAPHLNPSVESPARGKARSEIAAILEQLGLGPSDHNSQLVTSRHDVY